MYQELNALNSPQGQTANSVRTHSECLQRWLLFAEIPGSTLNTDVATHNCLQLQSQGI